MLLLLLPTPNSLSGALLLASALLITLRIIRWKLWHCPDRPDLLVLATGYLWLAAGAGITGLHLIMAIEPLPALLWLSASCWAVVYLGVTWQLLALFQADKQRWK